VIVLLLKETSALADTDKFKGASRHMSSKVRPLP